MLEHALQGEENSLGAEGLDLADYHEAIHDADRGSFRRRRSLGGIGTYPGGQSTGGSSEFTEENLRTRRPLTGKEEIMASEMRHEMWQVLDGGCKYANTTEELVECVSSAASLDQSDPLDQQALNIAKRSFSHDLLCCLLPPLLLFSPLLLPVSHLVPSSSLTLPAGSGMLYDVLDRRK